MEPLEIAVGLIQIVLKLIGVEKAKALLDQEAINRANAAADALEVARGLV